LIFLIIIELYFKIWYKKSMNFCIAGGRGFIGKILRENFSQMGSKVLILSRRLGSFYSFSQNEFCILWDGKKLSPEIIKETEVFINLEGETINGKLNKKKKEKIYKSRINSTRAIVNSILNSKKYPKYFFQASAIGIYKESENEINENSPYDNDFLANVVKDWENEVMPLKDLPIKLFIMRFGVVLGKEGGIFKNMDKLFKFGIGAIPGKGDYHISWIYKKDLVDAFMFLLENGKGGIYNFTSPKPIKGKDFFKEWGIAHKKWVFLHIPFLFLKLIYGKEIKEIIGKNLKVSPKALLSENFNFSYLDVKKVFEELTLKSK